MERLGIRELRNQTAAAVRRAGRRRAHRDHGRRPAGGPARPARPAARASRRSRTSPPAACSCSPAGPTARRPRSSCRCGPACGSTGSCGRSGAREARRMTLALDTTALLARYLDAPERAVVLEAMAADRDWCASALALTEALMLVDRVTDDPRRARRAAPGPARRLGAHRRRAGRPGLPRPRRRARPQPAAAHRRRPPPRRRRPAAPAGHLRHVRPPPDPRRPRPRLRRRLAPERGPSSPATRRARLPRLGRALTSTTAASRSTRSSSGRTTTTCSCCGARRPATPCCSTPPTSTSSCSSWPSASACAGCWRPTATGTTSRPCPAMREAGYEVAVTALDAPRLEGRRLRRVPRRRRGHRGRPAPPARHPHAGPHRGLDLLPGGGRARSCSAATPCSPAAPATPRSRAATSPRSSGRSSRRLFTLPGRHAGAARPRRRHHDRHRAAPPPGVDRPGLVTCGITAKADYAVRAMCELAARAGQRTGQGRRAGRGAGHPAQVPGEHPRRAEAVRARRQPAGRRGRLLAGQAGRPRSRVADVIRAVEGPLAAVRGQRPETLEFAGAAAALPKVWLAVRVSLRSVLERVTGRRRGQRPPAAPRRRPAGRPGRVRAALTVRLVDLVRHSRAGTRPRSPAESAYRRGAVGCRKEAQRTTRPPRTCFHYGRSGNYTEPR